MEIAKRLAVASSAVGRRDEQVEPRGFCSKEAILYKTCHYTFVPIFIEYRTPRVGPNVNYGLWVIMICPCRLIDCNQWAL